MINKRGYFGIALFEIKFVENVASILRSCKCFNANFICIINGRFDINKIDTTHCERHIPIFQYENLDNFLKTIPLNVSLIGIEVDGKNIKNFSHPERAIYVFGGEDRTLPKIFKERIAIPTQHCLNVSIATSIVMFDRIVKGCD